MVLILALMGLVVEVSFRIPGALAVLMLLSRREPTFRLIRMAFFLGILRDLFLGSAYWTSSLFFLGFTGLFFLINRRLSLDSWWGFALFGIGVIWAYSITVSHLNLGQMLFLAIFISVVRSLNAR